MRPSHNASVYLHVQPVDFRKSINGLAQIIELELELDPFSPIMFLFSNRVRDKVKLLYWQKNGFCLWYKRLEKDKFKWPSAKHDETVTLTGKELTWLLDGFDIFNAPPHQTLHFSSVD